MARSLNRVTLIGNLARDPEVRFTPSGSAVCTFTIATNRYWKTESGEQKEASEFHRIVAWDKLGELCGQLLKKGARAFVEGRLQTRKWTGQDGQDKYTTEIVITDMMVLDKKDAPSEYGSHEEVDVPADFGEAPVSEAPVKKAKAAPKKEAPEAASPADDDIPF